LHKYVIEFRRSDLLSRPSRQGDQDSPFGKEGLGRFPQPSL
jgi:hypothetical protein